MSKSLAELKAAWKKKASSEPLQNNYYKFYSMDVDSKAVVRFLPDLNDSNPLGFIYEKFTHTLTINGKQRTVPCLKMYEKDCPICAKSAEFYKIEGKETVTGKRLYRRKQDLAQVLVIEDPLRYSDDQVPSLGKVKLINMGFTLVNIINAAFNDDELEAVPWDYARGTDFIIKKSQKGDYANYELSKFARQERSLTQAELAAIEGNLIDLSTLIPECPSEDSVLQMLDADLNGTPLEESGTTSNASTKGNSIDPQASTTNVDSYKGKVTSTEDSSSDDVQTPVVEAKKTDTSVSESSDDYEEEAESILAQLKQKRVKPQ